MASIAARSWQRGSSHATPLPAPPSQDENAPKGTAVDLLASLMVGVNFVAPEPEPEPEKVVIVKKPKKAVDQKKVRASATAAAHRRAGAATARVKPGGFAGHDAPWACALAHVSVACRSCLRRGKWRSIV